APTGPGATGGFAELHRGASGDPRGTSQNGLTAELLGDYVYAVATRTYGAAVWNDARNAADCPAIDAYRMALESGDATATPPPVQQACPANFGNSDIYGGSYPAPLGHPGHLRGQLPRPDAVTAHERPLRVAVSSVTRSGARCHAAVPTR